MRASQTFAVAALTATAAAQDITKSSCVDGLYMLVARGTGEPDGPGKTGAIAERIAERIKDSKVQGLDYPATFTDPAYAQSVLEGSAQVAEVVEDYAERCPGKKIAVFGFSQGAQVAANAFCGGATEQFESDLKPVDEKIVKENVISIALFGDPTHVNGINFDKGTSKKDGLFSREKDTICSKDYTSIVQSFCDTGDVYCDLGNDKQVHGDYVVRYGTDVVEFVLKAWNEATDSDVDTDGGKKFPRVDLPAAGNVTVPAPNDDAESTPTPSETGAAKPSETGGSGNGEEGGEDNGDDGEEQGGDGDSAAAGLTAFGSMLVSAPIALALWNLL